MVRDLICPVCGEFGFKSTEVYVTGESASLKCVHCGEWSAPPKWKTVAMHIAEVERLTKKIEDYPDTCEGCAAFQMAEQEHKRLTSEVEKLKDLIYGKNGLDERLKAASVGWSHWQTKATQLQSSLTLSRAEGRRQGLEEAGKIVDGVKSYYEQKSMEAELAVVDNAWSQAAYEAELAAAAIREAAQPKEGE